LAIIINKASIIDGSAAAAATTQPDLI